MKKILLITLLSLMSFILLTDSVRALKINTFVPILVDVEGTDGAGTSDKITSCSDLGELKGWLDNALKFVQYAGVGLAVVLTAVDFIQVIGGSKEDDLKKAFDRTVKRLIAVVLLLLTGVLVGFIINTFVDPVIDEKIENCLSK